MEKKYNQYCKTFAHCLPYGTTKDWQKINYAQSQGFNDVQIQCHWIFEKLKERQRQCDYLVELTNSYDEKYKENLKFIASSEQYINEHNSVLVDPAMQLEKCSVSTVSRFVNTVAIECFILMRARRLLVKKANFPHLCKRKSHFYVVCKTPVHKKQI